MTHWFLANAFTESLEHIVGFLIVLVTLATLWLITAAMGRFFVGVDRRRAAVPAAPATASQPAPGANADTATAQSISSETVAAVAAAAYLVLGKRHRIIAIRNVSADWGREGRRQHFASRKIR